MWKQRAFSDIPNGLFVKIYELCEQEVTENFKVWVIFTQLAYIHKHKCFSTKIHKFSGERLHL
jgi:cell fate (sporulation/competence/biofilm development) regulator YmcA (YheA/YmcA/DUF963 family)